jgi:hypothetical protein
MPGFLPVVKKKIPVPDWLKNIHGAGRGLMCAPFFPGFNSCSFEKFV